MTVSALTRLGPYELLNLLGAGGMGEVYRARDTRLQREVAVKVLPARLACDAVRLERFEREARATSALNHPNIVTIHEVGQIDSTSFIVMELVDGKTLRELLYAGPLALRKLLSIAARVADGLAKAHASGIVHRDMKPENVMVSSDGFVKILDFGLAKLTHPDSEKGQAEKDPTIPGGTEPGVAMGTVGYMSPEQAAGQRVDFRSDQFSFGSILYEMATGKRAFERPTRPETLAAIIREEPEPIEKANPRVPGCRKFDWRREFSQGPRWWWRSLSAGRGGPPAPDRSQRCWAGRRLIRPSARYSTCTESNPPTGAYWSRQDPPLTSPFKGSSSSLAAKVAGTATPARSLSPWWRER